MIQSWTGGLENVRDYAKDLLLQSCRNLLSWGPKFLAMRLFIWSTWHSEQLLTGVTTGATSEVDWSLYTPLNIQEYHKVGNRNSTESSKTTFKGTAAFPFLWYFSKQFGALPHHFSPYSIRVWIWMWVLYLSICVSAVMGWRSALALSQASNLMPQSVFLPLHSKNVNIDPGHFWRRGNIL